jgi:hypothetical protein
MTHDIIQLLYHFGSEKAGRIRTPTQPWGKKSSDILKMQNGTKLQEYQSENIFKYFTHANTYIYSLCKRRIRSGDIIQ